MLGHRGCGPGGLAAQQRRLVAGGHHHDRARHAFLAQVLFDEFLDLAAAFADQADHDHVGIGVACQHRHQGGFAHPRAGKDAHSLAAADRGEQVDAFDPGFQLVTDAAPVIGGQRAAAAAGAAAAVAEIG